LPRIQLII